MNNSFKISLLLLIILLSNCDYKVRYNNSTDPLNPNYKKPTVKISEYNRPNENAVTVYWEGNVDNSRMMFSYKLDSTSWSIPSNATSKLLDNLDDTSPDLLHEFIVKGIYNTDIGDYLSDDKESQDTLSFWIDAIPGPSFRVAPLYQEVESLVDEISVEVIAEEVENLRYFECTIKFESEYMNYTGYTKTEGFDTDVLFVDSLTNTTMRVTGGMLSNGSGYTGSGSLIKLSFNKINNSPQDTATISISNAVFYDTNGDSISVNQIKEGLVVIQ